MKRLTALALCLTTVFTLGTSVSAATTLSSTAPGSNSTEQQITGTYVEDTEAIVYNVDIEWSDFKFEYNTGSKGVWDPATHSYSEAKPTGWGNQKGTITVTNHSNADVKYTITYNKGDSKYDNFYLAQGKGFTTPVTSIGGSLQSAVGKTVANAPSKDLAFYPGGKLPKGTNNATIGSLTVAIDPIK